MIRGGVSHRLPVFTNEYRGKENFIMRKVCCALLLLALAGLAGCATAPMAESANWTVTAAPEPVTQWPENGFTAQIPQPDKGTVDYVLDCSDSGHYGIFLKDISLAETSAYLNTLTSQGYVQAISDGNSVSIGTMLQKENVTLSIAQGEGTLGILITVDGTI